MTDDSFVFLKSPMTSVVAKVTAKEGRRLASYGWLYVKARAYREYVVGLHMRRLIHSQDGIEAAQMEAAYESYYHKPH